ncbi:hypothetical protein N7510_011695 [Penicillium lagena]|uniref:uncharacterized protein n=1 Tax=Penicillium lagena TaxID=94218 RepID=UPI00253F8382|nr:uncharacterized protein N7510_011695 [Penicillium lagena]KAJ5602161.1 hypothetical protein N7510_011695 [Penicillium lagena]
MPCRTEMLALPGEPQHLSQTPSPLKSYTGLAGSMQFSRSECTRAPCALQVSNLMPLSDLSSDPRGQLLH